MNPCKMAPSNMLGGRVDCGSEKNAEFRLHILFYFFRWSVCLMR